MIWKNRTQVVHTEAEPPIIGSTIFPTIGSQQNSRKALTNSVTPSRGSIVFLWQGRGKLEFSTYPISSPSRAGYDYQPYEYNKVRSLLAGWQSIVRDSGKRNHSRIEGEFFPGRRAHRT